MKDSMRIIRKPRKTGFDIILPLGKPFYLQLHHLIFSEQSTSFSNVIPGLIALKIIKYFRLL